MSDISDWQLNKKRPRYFAGRYLLAEDFTNQHDYLSNRQRYLHHSLYVSGVIEGLEVTQENGNKVEISNGSAVDNEGHLIVVDDSDDALKTLEVTTNGFVYISWKEEEEDEQEGGEKRNIKPSFHLEVRDSKAGSGVKLAQVTVEQGSIEVICDRVYSGICLPNSNGNNGYTIRSWQKDGASQGVAIEGSLKISESLLVEGKVDIQDSLTLGKEDQSCTLQLGQDGTLNVTKGVAIEGSLKISESLLVEGKVDIQDSLTLGKEDQSCTLQLGQDGTLNVTKGVAIEGSLKISESLLVEGKVDIQDSLTLSKDEQSCTLQFGQDGTLGVTKGVAIEGDLKINTLLMKTQTINNIKQEISEAQPSETAVVTEKAIVDYIEKVLADHHPTKDLEFDLGDGIKLEMIYIQAEGIPFDIGKLHESDSHIITFKKDFYIGKFPVTEEQYNKVKQGKTGGERKPKVNVSWNDICDNGGASFLEQLNDLLVVQLGSLKFRLPSESEWEYACRAGTDTIYFFGDDDEELKNYAWYIESDPQPKSAKEVGKLLPNNWNLYDILGNVWECCEDKYDDITQIPTDGTANNDATSDNRLLRGGSWLGAAFYCRCAYRANDNPDRRDYHLGFRVVCSV
ncbi:MAG: SUMF1/EgtB/PvdO family nonheme iron enzyme [Symploca sp. SIO1B1]|nr:SUMF1/EgtB/PvdO family nonheme iron enzyme [Symploca sp. SIO1B1]